MKRPGGLLGEAIFRPRGKITAPKLGPSRPVRAKLRREARGLETGFTEKLFLGQNGVWGALPQSG